ncbi:MAG: serine hydrolase [Deltaproteobacteria bacterium]|nr:serine hydrolase [Deltaproteobacteria bacterium]
MSAVLVLVLGPWGMGCDTAEGPGQSERWLETAAPAGDPMPWGDPEPTTGGGAMPEPARVGIFSSAHNYFELDDEAGPLQFHFGADNSRWGATVLPIAGDWDGDGTDTVGRFDTAARQVHLADANDSDELFARGQVHPLGGLPPAPPVAGEVPSEIPIAGDWDGDGSDGVGVYHPATRIFYLIDDPATGVVTAEIDFSGQPGVSGSAWPVAGDWDGNGDDEIGLFAAGTVSLYSSLVAGPPAVQFATGGFRIVAGDWDGDGVDTVGSFAADTNTFTLYHHNTASSTTETRQLGHAEAGYWSWYPVAGAWQVPTHPVARDGYDWEQGPPQEHGLDADAIASALQNAASIADVQSVLVVRDGVLVAERYYHGYERHIAGNIKSVSKSVLSGLFGIAFDQDVFPGHEATVASQLPSYFTGEVDPAKLEISLGDLLTMRGGLAWTEGPSFVSQGMVPSPDYTEFVLEQPVVAPRGTLYNYSTGLTQVASGALTEAAGLSTRAFARLHLFEPLDISTPRWDRSPEGYFVGGAEMWMRPRDMARFGHLYLRGGQLAGEPILTSQWASLSANPWIPESSGRQYGLWWRERPWSNYPATDSYFAWGHGGQFIFLFPSWDLQVVVTSKWNVSKSASGSASTAIFNFVDGQILTAVQD